MLMRIRMTGRRRIALLWAMSLLFAIAPALGMGAHAGTFSGIVVHAHDQGEVAHSHHVHDHDGQERNLGSSDVDDGPGQNRLHVHHDASCASMFMLVPMVTAAMLEHRVGDALGMPQTQPIQGSSPDNLLRPPIFRPYL